VDRFRGRRAAADGPTRHRWAALALVVALGAAAIGLAGDRSGPLGTTPGPLPVVRSDAATLALVEHLERASLTPAELRFEGGFPRGFVGRVPAAGDTPLAQARAFLAAHAELYGLTDPAVALDVRRQATIAGAAHTVTFGERYRGLPVHGGELVVQIVAGDVVSAVGALVHGYGGETVPALGPADAERLARKAVNAEAAEILGRTTLMILDPSLWTGGPSSPRLVWRVAVGEPVSGLVFMDATSGELLSVEPFGEEESDPFDTMDLDLEDAENDSSAALDDCYVTSDETEVGDEDEIDSDYANDLDAYHAWKYARDAYAFYHNTFGRHGWDDDDDEINVYIRALVNNGKFVACEDGSTMMEFKENYLADDVVVHEFTHGVIWFTSELNSSNWPSSSLNEGLSDVMAAFADGDWLEGEDVPAKFHNGWPANRSLSDPPSIKNYPDRWSERQTSEYPDTGISSKAAWLLTVGGQHPDTGVTVQGIGTAKARFLYYMILQQLPSSANFFDLRDSMVGGAGAAIMLEDLYETFGWPTLGFNANDVCQVRNAFGAVELGNVDLDCDGQAESLDEDNDTVGGPFDNCDYVANKDQADMDGDGVGDLCDPDYLLDADHDGVKDWQDNCLPFYNPDQIDEDGDGLGVPCDGLDSPDVDHDGVLNEVDNCFSDANADQADVDKDGEGDACDADTDGDGYSNDNDVCPFTSDPGQVDTDGDGLGDACDECPDDAENITSWTSGIADLGIDPKPIVPDSDGDGTPDACDGSPWGRAIVVPASVLDVGGLDARVIGDETLIQFETGRVNVPIVVCDPEPCWDAPPPDACIGFDLAGAVDGLVVGVVDDRGIGVGSARHGERRSITFKPKGGRSYWLRLSVPPTLTGIDLAMSFAPCKVEPDSPPQTPPGGPGPSATPTASGSTEPPGSVPPSPSHAPGGPSATPSPGSQPTGAPTAKPTPTPRPTPQPTPRPTPRPTPQPTPCTVPAPALASPADGSTVGSLQPTLAWRYPSAACPPLRQRVQVATDRSMTTIVYDRGLSGTAVDWTPPAPLDNCTWYYWRIIPIGSDGAADPASPVGSFFVQATRC
jgi:Zn-dependent metalloprotease